MSRRYALETALYVAIAVGGSLSAASGPWTGKVWLAALVAGAVALKAKLSPGGVGS